ncbi:signal peptidase II [bacterium 1XD8-76]|nr:signal peptidase II [bacterium 1XD8-76]
MRYILMILTIFTGELFWKDHVEREIPEGSSKKALRNTVILTKHHNYGAAFNTGERRPGIVKGISVLLTVLAAIFFIFSFGTVGKGMLKFGLSLLLGGAFSNTYDRLRRGYVVDYFRLNVPAKRIRNLIFNISDFCIVVGAVLAVLGEQELFEN